MKYWIFLVCIIVYKVLINLYKYVELNSYYSDYQKYLANEKNHCSRNKNQAIKLIKNAGVVDNYVPISQPSGYGTIATISASVFTNYPTNSNIFAGGMLDAFDAALGTYRSRIIESFNPLFWIETILFLPRNLLDYLGISKESIAYKLCNLIFTFLWWLSVTLFAFFRSNLINHIIEFLRKL